MGTVLPTLRRYADAAIRSLGHTGLNTVPRWLRWLYARVFHETPETPSLHHAVLLRASARHKHVFIKNGEWFCRTTYNKSLTIPDV